MSSGLLVNAHASGDLESRENSNVRDLFSMPLTCSHCAKTRYAGSKCNKCQSGKKDQAVYKPGSVQHPKMPVWPFLWDGRCRPPRATYPDDDAKTHLPPPRGATGHPYLVLLPVGFTVPRPLPSARCALTAPFHPYPSAEADGRFAFCGTFPRVAPAGRYPAPCLRGARTFLQRLAPPAAIQPPDRRNR